jgi:hypothetical protein
VLAREREETFGLLAGSRTFKEKEKGSDLQARTVVMMHGNSQPHRPIKKTIRREMPVAAE